MSISLSTPTLNDLYESSAIKYLQSLPLEHFMESTPHATQRKIMTESMDLVHAQRPEIQTFSELLIQYPKEDEEDGLGKVVPDNMVVICKKPIEAEYSFSIPLQPVRPFWVVEYVSKRSKKKDEEDNFVKYEKHLQVPYYLLYYWNVQELKLYRLRKGAYSLVLPNKQGRIPIPKIDLEIAMLDGWVRFWFQGELLPLPAEMLNDLKAMGKELAKIKRRAKTEKRRAEEAKRRADEEKQRAEKEKQRAEKEKQRADEAKRLAIEEKQRADESDVENARLRAELEKLKKKSE